jgi:sarcosine oxidase subunit gamma
VTVERDAVSPLAHRGADLGRIASDTRGALEVTEAAFETHLDLRLHPAEAGRVAFELPLEPNTVSRRGAHAALWLGPDEWLVVAPPAAQPRIAGELSTALAGVHASIVDVSANRAVLQLRGPARHEMLSKGCSLDLQRWSPDRCAQTLLGRAQVIVEERTGVTRVYVRPSFGDYLVDWILDATQEYRLLEGGA